MNAKQYVREIVQRSCLPAKERRKLKIDLENEIDVALERGESIELIIERMGDPDKLAAEIYENYAGEPLRPFREYKSSTTLFGLPLVHIIRMNYAALTPNVRAFSSRRISIGRRYSYPGLSGLPAAHGVFALGPKAKGIISVGNLSTGLISIGNLSAGLISIGNVSGGLFSLGNISLALLVALGNFAAGALSAGNLAVGYGVAGNLACGEFAVGNEVMGTHTFSVSNLHAQFETIKMFFRGLDAPAPIKVFFGYIEKLLEVFHDPMSATLYIIGFLFILAIIILILCIVPNRLLNRNYEPN